MVNFESEMPHIYWTRDDVGQERRNNDFDHSIWKSDLIQSFSIGEAAVSFDSPQDWGGTKKVVQFLRTPDGRYEHHSEGIVDDAVRADTTTHVVLTGKWSAVGFENGVFIVVFPIKPTEHLLLDETEETITTPEQSAVAAAAATVEA
jgi:hypothetical protein